MPLLGPGDPLPARATRVLVAGTSGSGKTTLVRAIAAALDLPHTEIDALFHGAGWVPRPQFEADVAAMLATDRWVTEYQYPAGRATGARIGHALTERPDLPVVVLRSPREVRAWTAGPLAAA